MNLQKWHFGQNVLEMEMLVTEALRNTVEPSPCPSGPVAYAGFFNGGGLKSDIKNSFAIYTLANK